LCRWARRGYRRPRRIVGSKCQAFEVRRYVPENVVALLGRGVWGVADQALISGASFGTLVLIARAMSPSEFGLVALAMTFISLEMALVGATLNQPFAVLSASRDGAEYRRYVSSTLAAQVLLGSAVSVPMIALAGASSVLQWRAATVIALVVPAMLAWQVLEFIRQVLYVEGRLRGAFLNTCVNNGGQLVVISGLWWLGPVTPGNVLTVVAAMTTLSTVIGLYQLRGSVDLGISFGEFVADNRANWRFSRWTLGGTLLSVSSNFAVPFVVAAASGPAAAGVIRALVTVMGPTHILTRTFGMLFGPAAARSFEGSGVVGLRRMLSSMYWVVLPPMLAYCALVGTLAQPALRVLYGDTYIDYAWLLRSLAASHLMVSAYGPLEIALRALRATNSVFRAYLLNFLALWGIGVPCILFLDLGGVAILFVIIPPLTGAALACGYAQATRAHRMPDERP
jgi:O-antigen/teichoic acid export membrane protein